MAASVAGLAVIALTAACARVLAYQHSMQGILCRACFLLVRLCTTLCRVLGACGRRM